MNTKKLGIAKKIALVGIMTASIECVKLALMALPNIEAVSLLTALYGYAFGPLGVLASAIFVAIEPLIWGYNLWVVSYFLYFPPLAALFMLLGRIMPRPSFKVSFSATAIALVSTAWFGVLTSLIDIGLLTGYYEDFFTRFTIYYARGISFYIAQLVSNAVLFPLLFLPLSKALIRIKRKMLA